MKTKIYSSYLTAVFTIVFLFVQRNTNAQNTFPTNGRAGIYTTSPAASLQVRGGARIGTTTNYTNIDSATGNLSFVGNAAYKVAGNKYAFQYSGNSNYGLFFNSTNVQYEFRNGSAVPVFYVNANSGNGVFTGNLKVGAYTLPASDGANGQMLKTNGSGVLTWSNDNGSGSGWSLTGNAGTNASTNFIGTTDAQSLIFKVNGLRAGLIDYSTCCSGTRNTSFGQIALNSITAGADNTATGYGSLYTNTTGNENVAYGKYALFNNNADDNTALGFNAMFFNTTGINNTATGSVALQNNTTGQQNTANGFAALASNSTGNYNTAVGSAALNNNDATYNTAVGAYAMYLNTNGVNNTSTGSSALYNNTTGSNNTSIGFYSLYNNNTYDKNTAVGSFALYYNGGSENTAVGSNALHSNNSSQNTAVGERAMYANTGNGNNVAVGNSSGYYSSTNGTFIGWDTYGMLEGSLNSTALGYHAPTTADNQVRLGDGNITSIGGAVGFSVISDARFKKNVKENVPGLDFIKLLRPVTYNFDANVYAQTLAANSGNLKDKKSYQSVTDKKAADNKSRIEYTGFIAQEVEASAKKINYDFSGVDAPKNAKDYYGLRYAEFVVPLVKAVQELSKMNDIKDAKINELETRLTKLETLLNVQSTSVSTASLEQNIPNPFSNTTIINYTLPQKFTSAQMMITDKNGKTLKTINVSGSGKGNLKVDAATLASGAYSYSLVVNGKLISTKEMILAK